MFVAVDGKLSGSFFITDKIRPGVKETIARLEKMGIETVMLTGDHELVAAHIARDAGIGRFFAGVLPQEKAGRIEEVQRDGSVVAMVGDGINDAPALAAATSASPWEAAPTSRWSLPILLF